MASWRSDLNLKTLVAKQMSMYIPHLIDIFNKPELYTEKMRMPNLFSDDVVYRDGYNGPDYLPYNFQERSTLTYSGYFDEKNYSIRAWNYMGDAEYQTSKEKVEEMDRIIKNSAHAMLEYLRSTHHVEFDAVEIVVYGEDFIDYDNYVFTVEYKGFQDPMFQWCLIGNYTIMIENWGSRYGTLQKHE